MIVSKEIRRGDGWWTIERSAIQRDEYHFRVVLFTLLEKLAYQLPAASVGLPFLMFKTDAWLNIHFHISRYVSNVKHSCTMATVTRRRKGEKRWRKKKEDGEERRTGTSGN